MVGRKDMAQQDYILGSPVTARCTEYEVGQQEKRSEVTCRKSDINSGLDQ